MHPAPAAIPHPALAAEDRPGAVLDAARRTRSALVAVTGLPGVGKSTWVRQLIEAGSGRARIIATTADAFEQSLPFALADKVARAAGIREGLLDAPTALDLLSAGRALLPALTRGVSSGRPLCVIVDNAQWIDDASAGVLRFVLGRVAHGGLLVVLSGHAPRVGGLAESIVAADPTAWGEVRPLAIDPLDAPEVREYASRVHGREISLRLAERIRDLSGGLPVHIDALVAGMERTAPDRSHWDEDVQFPSIPENPFHTVGTGATSAIATTVEIASVLRGSLERHELLGVAHRLGESADIAGALAAGLLVTASDQRIAPFHDLYAADVATRIDPAKRRGVLTAAADALSSTHRALVCRLDAAEELDPLLLAEVRTTAAGAVSEGQPDRAIEYLRRASALADPQLRDELVVEICILAAAELVSPSVLDLLPELERMPSSPLRDLALLQTRQITGDIPWAAEFAAGLLAASVAHPDARTLELHTAMLAVMIQLTTGDYGPLPALLDRTRDLADALAAHPAAVADRRLLPLPSPAEVGLRATALLVLSTERLGLRERTEAELDALGARIGAAIDSPALSDALVCRAGHLGGIGRIAEAATDLERVARLRESGVAGWSIGHARVQQAYCAWLLGRTAEAAERLEEAIATVLDSIDVSARPLSYLLRAVLHATAGDTEGYERDLRTAAEVTVTAYDTMGVELELLAAVVRARAQDRPEEVLEILSDERIGPRWLAGTSIFTYRVDALAALGRAEEADRELARLTELAGDSWEPIFGGLDWLEGRVAEAYGLHDRAIRAYRRATKDGLPGPRAQAAFDAGRLLLASGEGEAGDRMLGIAAKGFGPLGAHDALRRISLLRDAPASEADRALAGLSGREREVAVLAGSGLTNSEIAERLYLSPATVAFHMRNVLAKLGLRSRRELRGLSR
ncbi:hypothetical protein XM48_02010 [Leucobacter sp. Ag1]|uniref:helix-turn-helix transcriptional regulator n=3 Tax=Leucobacter TaxID=55968 RepID=UPI000622257E|nr:LuxR family transcriptional regulator [Leucobacter sp. Ag1]KKI22334.1 hypothetical protein XM48_02010 [Leucobacter sp. Ag1]